MTDYTAHLTGTSRIGGFTRRTYLFDNGETAAVTEIGDGRYDVEHRDGPRRHVTDVNIAAHLVDVVLAEVMSLPEVTE
jgi:hypothetical protein